MAVIALLSAKGGVGKTTAAVNLAALWAATGHDTLLIDLDPQGAAGHLLKIHASGAVKAKRFWSGRADAEAQVRASDFDRLDVLPADDSLRRAEAVLEDIGKSRRRLADLLARLTGWTRIVIDCPPGLGLIAENAIRAADLALVPVAPSALAVRVLEPLSDLAGNRNGKLRPFVSMLRGNSNFLDELRLAHPATLSATIPSAAVAESAARSRLPVVAHAPRSPLARAYRALLAESEALLTAEGTTVAQNGGAP